MKKILQILAALSVVIVTFTACEKLSLQKKYKYKSSRFDPNVDQTVWEFMNTRKELFSGLIEAIEYASSDAKNADVKKLYMQPEANSTYMLLTDNALINLEDGNSYYSKMKRLDTDPTSPTNGQWVLAGTDWSQYSKDTIAELLKYHVLKGNFELKNLNSRPIWAPSYAVSATNDSAYMNLYLEASRDGFFNINGYPGSPTGATIRPRTPDLHLKGAVIVNVMDRFMYEPTRKAIADNP